MFNKGKPYERDVKLLRKLGLNEWEANLNEETFIGEVFPPSNPNHKNISIKVYVTCAPSQFYKFIVNNKDEDIHCVIETGSGSFTKYYPMTLAIAEGCLVVNPLVN